MHFQGEIVHFFFKNEALRSESVKYKLVYNIYDNFSYTVNDTKLSKILLIIIIRTETWMFCYTWELTFLSLEIEIDKEKVIQTKLSFTMTYETRERERFLLIETRRNFLLLTITSSQNSRN